jgi:AcrR family transcriptional regulator
MARDPRVRRRLDPSKRRQQLLDVGLDLLDRTGDQPSTREVAERAGVTPGLLYRYFPDQRAYHQALLEEAATGESASARWPQRPFAEALRDALRAQIEFAARHEGRWRALRTGPAAVRAKLQKEQVERVLQYRPGLASPSARLLVLGWVGLCQSAIEAWLADRNLPAAELAVLLTSTLDPILTAAHDGADRPRRRKPRVRLLAATRPPPP